MKFASGVSIAVFFYDGPTSRAIAFEGLLNSGEAFAARLKAGLKDGPQPQLVHVATDGESYGHHHTHGEMALAYALRLLEDDKTVRLTNYGSFLDQFPPEYECEIETTPRGAASMASSVGAPIAVATVASPAGIRPGARRYGKLWTSLRDALVPLTEQEGVKLFKDVWAARDAYIEVILDRTPETVDRFFLAQERRILSAEDRVHALALMELQRHTQLMFTSCGWFFDDISGIETVQVIAYAARVLQLAAQLFGERAAALEPAFLARMAEARSNVPSAGDGAAIYKNCVATMQLGLEQVAAHYAISSVFSSFAEETDLFCYRVRRISYDIYTSGRGRLALGRAHVVSSITGFQGTFSFAVLHFGDQNITAAVKPYEEADAADFEAFAGQAAEQVQRAYFPEVIRLLDRYYGHVDYSLTSLFTDEQRRIVQLILNSTLWDIESSLTTIYDDHASLLHYLPRPAFPSRLPSPWLQALPSTRACAALWNPIPSTRLSCVPICSWPKPTRFPWRRRPSLTSPISA